MRTLTRRTWHDNWSELKEKPTNKKTRPRRVCLIRMCKYYMKVETFKLDLCEHELCGQFWSAWLAFLCVGAMNAFYACLICNWQLEMWPFTVVRIVHIEQCEMCAHLYDVINVLAECSKMGQLPIINWIGEPVFVIGDIAIARTQSAVRVRNGALSDT